MLAFAVTWVGAAERKAKKLIEFGWDEPSTSFMREHITKMERAPFDGVVFNAEARKAKGAKRRFTWEAWGTNRFEEVELQQAIEDLRATGSNGSPTISSGSTPRPRSSIGSMIIRR